MFVFQLLPTVVLVLTALVLFVGNVAAAKRKRFRWASHGLLSLAVFIIILLALLPTYIMIR